MSYWEIWVSLALTQILFFISFDHCFMVSAIQKESFGLKVILDWYFMFLMSEVAKILWFNRWVSPHIEVAIPTESERFQVLERQEHAQSWIEMRLHNGVLAWFWWKMSLGCRERRSNLSLGVLNSNNNKDVRVSSDCNPRIFYLCSFIGGGDEVTTRCFPRCRRTIATTSADRVHGTWLQIHQDGTRDIATTSGFIKVDVDSFQLEIRITVIGSSRVDTWTRTD